MATASVTGVVALPQGLSDSDPCSALKVSALQGQQPVGKVTIRQSRARCSYEITQLPAAEELVVEVNPPTHWQCKDGAAARFQPQTVRMQEHENQVRDFALACTLTEG